MPISNRFDIHDDNTKLILIDFVTGKFSGDDFGEDRHMTLENVN
jgi:hypothetical protein